MFGCSKRRKWILTVLTLALQSGGALAGNKLELQKENNALTIQLWNTDPVAGFQFTINARGGIALRSFGGSDRAAAGFAVYQYLTDDSTLNVIMLASVHSALPAGEGVLGSISFVLSDILSADTVRVFLSRVVICNANAEYLEVTSTQLAWMPRENSKAGSPLFVLEQNFPNPFNPSTTIAYTLVEPASVQLVVFDISGRELGTLVNQHQSAGRYTVQWNAAENGGLTLASGLYIARLQVGNRVALQKMLLMK